MNRNRDGVEFIIKAVDQSSGATIRRFSFVVEDEMDIQEHEDTVLNFMYGALDEEG